jgi:hypothetical protein
MIQPPSRWLACGVLKECQIAEALVEELAGKIEAEPRIPRFPDQSQTNRRPDW